MRKRFSKLACSMLACGLTFITTGVATYGCYFMFHQPKEPENLKKFSKNK